MKASKLKYQLRVLISPSLWLRNEEVSKEFDEWMWRRMDDGVKPTLEERHPLIHDFYYADFDGLKIWIKNRPYADATHSVDGDSDNKHSPSAATALRFRELLAPLLDESRRFVPPT